MNPHNAKSPPAPLSETDPRFPSGPWRGFWIQFGLGRQRMLLSLAFHDGKVTGHGTDIIGRFTLEGTYDLQTGRCLMTKQYDGAHRVEYDGRNEGDGMWLWGLWKLMGERGGFHLWPEGEEDPTNRRLKAAKDLPASPPAPKRKEEGELVEARS